VLCMCLIKRVCSVCVGACCAFRLLLLLSFFGTWDLRWIPVALRPAPIPPLFPPVLLVSLPIPRCALRSSWCLCALRSFWCPSLFPRVSPGAPGVSWILQQHSVQLQHSNSLVRPAAAAPFGVLLPAVRWLSSLAVAHAFVNT
jgi:hypothetical protein